MSEITTEPSIASLNFERMELFNRCKTDLNFLAGMAMPLIFTSMFPPVFLALWEMLLEKCSIDNIFRLLLGLPRGHAKTTFIKLFCLYCILFTNRQFILIICASQPKAENFLSDVVDMLDEENIVNIFGNWKLTLETDKVNLKKFVFMGRDIILAASGQGSVRGINIKNRRPDVIVMDDVQDKENAESDTESHKLLNWIQSTVMKLRDPHRCFFIFIGNKYKVDPSCVCILEKLQNNKLWFKVVTGAILSDGLPLWPELHNLESLMEEFQNDFNMGCPEIFLAEIMNDTDANLNALVDLTKVPLSPYDNPDQRALCQGRFVIIDVATNKVGADDTVLGLYGIYDAEKVNMEELKVGSFDPKQTIQEALKFCFTKGANVIAVEDTAYQGSLLFWFEEVCKELQIGEGLYFVALTPIGKKTARIIAFLKQILKKNPDIYIGMECRELLFNQALAYKPAKQKNSDDVLDNGSYWNQFIEKYKHLVALPAKIDIKDPLSVLITEDNCCF